MASFLHALRVPALMAACLLFPAGCGGSDPAHQADDAQSALSEGHYAEARSKAEAALKEAGAGDKTLAWKLERIRVEAIARQGDGAEVLSTAARLSGAYPQQCDAFFYGKLGTLLVEAGEPTRAVEVAHAGIEKFPDRKSDFDGLIRSIEESGDAEAIAKLKAMGYL